MGTPEVRGVRLPKQDRSKRTLDLLAGSAEAVLRGRTFDEAPLQEIVDGAGVTTGAFYARFRAKDDLLRYLEEEINEALLASAERHLGSLESKSGDPVAFFRDTLRDLVIIYRRHRGAIRAIIERSRSDPAMRERRTQHARASLQKMEDALTRIMGKGRPDFRERVRVGSLFVMGAVREVFLYQEFWPADMIPEDETLVEELVTAFFSYVRG